MATDSDRILTTPPPAGDAPERPQSARASGEHAPQAGLTVPLDGARKAALAQSAERFLATLVALNPNSPEFGRKVAQLTSMGQREIAAAAGQSNRFLARPMRALDSDTRVGDDLNALRLSVEQLDPGRRGDLLKPKKLFGLLPYGSRLRDYFESYKSAQAHIGALLNRLAEGKDELLRDNAAIDIERQALWTAMGRLEQRIFLAKALDSGLAAHADRLERDDPEKARALRENALFYVRQRTTDLLTQMAVSMQGYLALDLVRKNNVELMLGVERASTTTVSALRTAVTVAQALTQQRLVLQQIQALSATTARVLESTTGPLRAQSELAHRQAASPSVPLETLQRAFQNVYSTMDAIEGTKTEALATLKATVDALGTEVEHARGRLERSQKALEGRGGPEPFQLAD
jgi:uncharacterized protein YaaN involved in tellurite resistance